MRNEPTELASLVSQASYFIFNSLTALDIHFGTKFYGLTGDNTMKSIEFIKCNIRKNTFDMNSLNLEDVISFCKYIL